MKDVMQRAALPLAPGHSVRLHADLNDRLTAYVNARHTTYSEVLRDAIDEFLSRRDFALLAEDAQAGDARNADRSLVESLGGGLPWVSVELVGRSRHPQHPKVAGAASVFRLLGAAAAKWDRERLLALAVEADGSLLSIQEVAAGTDVLRLTHPGEVFRSLILARARACILAQNQLCPNASLTPDQHAAIERLRTTGDVLGIPVRDYVILAAGGYLSCRDAGLL